MKKEYHVYILTNATRVLYIGMTSNLPRRLHEHRTKLHPDGFTARYNVSWLVYFETFTDVFDALDREKQLKRWRREKKVALIESVNPRWVDITDEWSV